MIIKIYRKTGKNKKSREEERRELTSQELYFTTISILEGLPH
jgi:hypothetical protein